MKHEFSEQTVKWIENCLNGWAQRMVFSGMNTNWRPISFWNEGEMKILPFLERM